MRQVIAGIVLGLLAWLLPLDASKATIYYEYGMESSTCDIEVPNGTVLNGVLWCTNCGQSPGIVRCDSSQTPEGTKYLEWTVDCTSPSGDRCAGGTDTDPWHDGYINIGDGSWGQAIPADVTMYFGAFVKFSRIASRDIWQDTGSPNSWDKLIEYGGHGTSDATRWGVGSGWINSDYTATNGKFTFDAWCASSVITGACSPDHFVQNVSPYSSTTPYLADYDKWYALMLEVYMRSDTTGYMKLYVNGTNIIHITGIKTRNATGTLADIGMQGTIAQAPYDAPDHYRYLDYIILSDTLSDLTNAGLMSDPEASSSSSNRSPTINGGARFTGSLRLIDLDESTQAEMVRP